jgi:hypothetical protein
MLKIWLTWLQPSIGVLGTALVLSNPLYSSAAPNSNAANRATKTPAQPPQWSSAKSDGTSIDKALLQGIAVTPDQAVRQLAINTMVGSGIQPTAPTAKMPQSFSPLANFIGTPAKFKQLSAKANKPPQMKQSILAALNSTSKPKSKVLVPGLAIGTANVQVSSQVLPTLNPAVRTVSATTRVGTPVQLAAAMPETTVATPYPVVRPELMEKLQANPVVASVADVKTASRDLKSLGVIPTVSINPIAVIPNGLQQLLGNNLDGSIKVSVVPVVKATGPNFRSMAALTTLVSPAEIIAPATVTTASLRLATAQAYTSVPKFSIPGETVATTKPANVLTAKRVQKNSTTATIGHKSNYVAMMSNKGFISATRQSWLAVSQSSNLGGLILGSPQLATLPKVIGLLPASTMKVASFSGLTVSDVGNIN